MDFKPYFDRLFAELPDTPGSHYIEDKILQSMERQKNTYMEQGMSEHDAFCQCLFDFGSAQGLQAALFDDKVKKGYRKFIKNYRKMVRWGFLAIIIIPMIFMVLMFFMESKLVFLVLWIISIIGIATYLICMEYTYFKYKKLMSHKAGGRIDIMTSNVINKLKNSFEAEARNLAEKNGD